MSESSRLVCARCGAAFDCAPDGDCWCKAEGRRLPAAAEEQCLCPACLRQTARSADRR